MNWLKLGHIFRCDNYAQTPTPLLLDDRIRVYYASRSTEGKSQIQYVDLDLADPTKIISEPSPIVLANGKPGCFDHDGQMPSFAMRSGNNVSIYYSGWCATKTTPYHNSMGVASSDDFGQTFQRAFDGPILDRTLIEPYLAVTPCIITHGRMFYISGQRWEFIRGRWEPIYVICKATSMDGWNWQRDGVPVIQQSHPHECFSRPWVRHTENGYEMWYCYRGAFDYRNGPGAYRIGYATSPDCLTWTRCDEEAGITVSESGFDATMIAYPATFEVGGKTFMLYNGGTFGKHGFGLAVLEEK